MRKQKDYYFHKAKKEGYAARSTYKIQEIDQKYKLIRPGFQILDLGCVPGGWMQYMVKQVGDQGLVLGIDRNPIKISLSSCMRFIQADINELDRVALARFTPVFDLVVSDMAPNTSGIKSLDADRSAALCTMALDVSGDILRKGGSLVVKIFQGAALDQVKTLFKQEFKQVLIFKPKSSRDESKEVFLIGKDKITQPRDIQKD